MTGGSDVSIGLRISVEGTGGTISALGNVTQGVKNLGTASKETKTSLASIAAAAAGPMAALYAAKQAADAFIGTSRKLIQIADDYAGVTARMNLVSKSAVEMNTAMAGVFKTAQDARAPLAETAQLYYRLATAASQMGLSQKETLTITDAIAKSLKISGASSTETAGALQQLSQALQAGKLNGDEFRSVTENAARVVTALTDSLHIDIGTLREWSQQGKLTSEVVAKALVEQSGAIERDFAKIPITVEGAIQQLKNASELFIGMAGQAIPIGKALAEMFTEVAKSISEAALQLKGFFPSSSTSDQIVAFETRIGQLQEKLKGMSGSWFFDPDDYERTVRAIEEMQIKLEDLRKQQTANAAAAGSFFSGQKPTPAADPKAQEAAQRLLQAQVKQRIEAEKAGFEEFKAQQEVRLKAIEAEKSAIRDTAKLQMNSATTYKDAQSIAVKLQDDLNAKLDEEYTIRDDLLQVQQYVSSVAIDAYNSELAKAKEINLTDAEQVTIKTAIAEAESNIRQIQAERAQLEIETSEKERQLANDMLERKADEQKFLQKINDELKFQEELYNRLNEARARGANTQDLEIMRTTMEQSRSLGLNLPPEGVGIATETIKKTNELKLKNDELTDSYKNVREAALRALEVASSNLEYAKEVSSGLSEAFGQVGESIGGMTVALAEYAKQQETINVARQEAIENAKGDQVKIAQAEKDAVEKQAKAQVKSYGDIAQASQKFFKQGTKGYEAMGAATKVFRAFEMAQSALSFTKQLGNMDELFGSFKTMLQDMGILSDINRTKEIANAQAAGTAKAAEGAAQQGTSGDPYTAFARVAAWIALMAGIGFMIGGGGGSAPAVSVSDIQKQQDEAFQRSTATMLGSSDTSTSILDALEILSANSTNDLDYTKGMARNMELLVGSIESLSTAIATSFNFDVSKLNLGTVSNPRLKHVGLPADPLMSAIVGGIIGGTKINRSLIDQGISVVKQTLGSILDSGIVKAGQYANILVTKTDKALFGLFSSTSQSIEREASKLDPVIKRALGQVFDNAYATLLDAGEFLGKAGAELEDTLRNITFKKTDLKLGKDAKKNAEKIQAWLSAELDRATEIAFPDLADFRRVGEGMYETSIRVADGVAQAEQELSMLGLQAIKYSDIVSDQKDQIDVGTEITRQTILAQENLSEGTRKYVQELTGSAADIREAYTQLMNVSKLLRGTGFGNIDVDKTMVNAAGGLSAFEEAMQSFRDNFLTDAQRVAADTVDLTESFGKLGFELPKSKDEFTKLALILSKDTTEAGKKLFVQFMLLNGQFSQLTDASKELADAQAEAAQKIQDDLIATLKKNVDSAFSTMQKAYQDLQKVQERFLNYAKNIRAYLDELTGARSAYLSPSDRYLLAKEEFRKVSKLAAAGNEDALANIAKVGKDFIEASKDYNASGPAFQADLSEVTKYLQSAASIAESQASLAENQLKVAEDSFKELKDLNKGVISVRDGIGDLAKAMQDYANALREQAAQAAAGAAGAAGAPGSPENPIPVPKVPVTISHPDTTQAIAAGMTVTGNNGRGIIEVSKGGQPGWSFADGLPGAGTFYPYASGGNMRAGLSLVGEYGPELVSSRGGHVSSAKDTENFFASIKEAITLSSSQQIEVLKGQVQELQALVRLQSAANREIITQLSDIKSESSETTRIARLEASA